MSDDGTNDDRGGWREGFWHSVILLLAMLALAAVIWLELRSPAQGAPVPKALATGPLTAGELVGEWRFSWSDMENGRITFYADGTYRSHHHEHGQRYIGLWSLSGDTVTLFERRHDEKTNQTSEGEPIRYEFTLARAWRGREAVLSGMTPWLATVVLSEPKR